MKRKLRLSMVAFLALAAMFAQADDNVEKSEPNKDAMHLNCDFNYDGLVDSYEAQNCDAKPENVNFNDHAANGLQCDFNGDGFVDNYEMQNCNIPVDVAQNGNFCDFNNDGVVDDYERGQCNNNVPVNNPQPIDCLPGDQLCTNQFPQPTQTGNGVPIITFQPTQNVGDCLPGQPCNGYVATADDYFSPTLPGTSADVLLFTKNDVDQIVKKAVENKLQECRKDPKSCGIKLFSTTTSDLESIKNSIQDKSFKIQGVYINYGKGTFDWIYVMPDGSYAFKLEEGLNEKGQLRWSSLHSPQNKGFDQISVDPVNMQVYFGNTFGTTTLPGQ